ncbi:MAG: TonB-dependent receptor domain-containing protein [Bryobacteraceae bacterium]
MSLPQARKLAFSSVLGFLVLSSLSILYGQVAGGTLSGTITDPSGAVIASAQISIKRISTGLVRRTISDADGLYSVPNLVPSTYEVTISASGFETDIVPNIIVTVGSEQQLNAQMHVGQQTVSVDVHDVASGVELSTSTVSHVVTGITIRALPLNGRDWTQLATLQPGVNLIRAQPNFSNGATRGNRGFGAQLTISGSRPTENNYRLDGVSMNDYSNAGPGSILGGNLGVDAVQEFSVLTTNYSAEYGRTSGGVINGTTRSGTNQFHGGAYEFLRNSALDARNFFDGSSVPPFRRNQFGGFAGGPILKDHTFFFVDYEGLRQSLTTTHTNTVPSPSARQGLLCAASDCTTTTRVAVDPSVQKFLPIYPLPNGPIICPFNNCPTGGGDTGIYSFTGPQIVTENFVTTRLDHNFSERDILHGTYLYDDSPFSQPNELNSIRVGSHITRQFAAIEETHTFSPVVANSIRLGFNREVAFVDQSVSAINPLANDPSLAANPGQNAPQVTVPGLTTFVGGLGGPPNYQFHYTSLQAFDDAFATVGTHSIKFGFAFEHLENNILANSDASGIFRFGSLSDFLTNNPKSFETGIVSSITPRSFRQIIVGGYVQDDWRFRPNLTLNLGLRYEMATVPTEEHGKLSTLRNLGDPQPHLGSPLFSNPTMKNFEPRVGFSWDPFGNGKTAVRAGFGIYDVLPLPYEFELLETLAAPYFLAGRISNPPPGSFFAGASHLVGVDSSTLRVSYVQPNPARDYVMQWNLNVQRQLGKSLSVMVGYVGSHGVHQVFRADDVNMVLPVNLLQIQHSSSDQGYLWPTPAGSGQVLNPNVGQIGGIFWSNSTHYSGLQTQLMKALTHGFQFQVSYTLARATDYGSSGGTAGDPFANSISSLYFFDPRVRFGLSDSNVTDTLIVNWVWQISTPKTGSRIVNWALHGWEADGIFTAASGTPFTPLLGGDPLGQNSTDPFAFPDRLTGAGCSSAVSPGSLDYIKLQCFAPPSPVTRLGTAGRNSLIGPGLANLDFSLIKNNHFKGLSEDFNVQFRAEVFNILNHANFASPLDNSALFDQTGAPVPGAGLIDATVTQSREIQFAIKVVF